MEYTKTGTGINLQAQTFIMVNASDATVYTVPSNVYVGVGGDIVVQGAGGGTALLKNYPQGTIIPGLVTRIYATNTTAGSFVLLS